MDINQVKETLEQAFVGARVIVNDPQQDGQHLETQITYKGFKGKTLIEQHRMVQKALKKLLPDIHALSIKTTMGD